MTFCVPDTDIHLGLCLIVLEMPGYSSFSSGGYPNKWLCKALGRDWWDHYHVYLFWGHKALTPGPLVSPSVSWT